MKRACQSCGAIAECSIDEECSGLLICADCMTSRDAEFKCVTCGLEVCREEAEQAIVVSAALGNDQAKPRSAQCACCAVRDLTKLLNARAKLRGLCPRCGQPAAPDDAYEAHRFIVGRLCIDSLGDRFCSDCFAEGLADYLIPGGA